MIDFAIFAVTFVIFLLLLVFYLYPGSSRQTTIPGLDPSDSKEGNLPDILQAGGLHPFLLNLHELNGPIASFWMGPKLIVSLASPELFDQHLQIFDKPEDLFSLYKPVMGKTSIMFANGTEARRKRQYLDKFYSEEASKNFTGTLLKFSDELAHKWSTLPADQHIPLYQYMTALCMKVSTNITMGSYFQNNDNILDFSRNFEICSTELESRVTGSVPEPDSPREERLQNAVNSLHTIIKAATKQKTPEEGNTLLKVFKELKLSDQQIADEILTMIFKHCSTAAGLTWAIYFLATHETVQEKVFQELKEVLDSKPFTPAAMKNLRYLKQVIDETLRIAVVEPWSARVQDLDMEIGGHVIPKKTPVIHALGVVMCSDKFWSLPTTFNPERFNEDSKIQKQAFQPFGFAGKRHCPGKDITYLEMMLFLSGLCSKFKFHLVSGQVVNPFYGIITKPEEEIWITVQSRSK